MTLYSGVKCLRWYRPELMRMMGGVICLRDHFLEVKYLLYNLPE
jgi:hypothetical protein